MIVIRPVDTPQEPYLGILNCSPRDDNLAAIAIFLMPIDEQGGLYYRTYSHTLLAIDPLGAWANRFSVVSNVWSELEAFKIRKIIAQANSDNKHSLVSEARS